VETKRCRGVVEYRHRSVYRLRGVQELRCREVGVEVYRQKRGIMFKEKVLINNELNQVNKAITL